MASVQIFKVCQHVRKMPVLQLFFYTGEFLSNLWSSFRFPLGRLPTVGGAAMAIAELPMQHLFSVNKINFDISYLPIYINGVLLVHWKALVDIQNCSQSNTVK